MKCIICEQDHHYYYWTDLNGEVYCGYCGVPYQVVNHETRQGQDPAINLKEEAIPVVRKYWQQYKKNMGLGTFIIRNPNQQGLEDFSRWLERQPEYEAISKP